MLTLPSSTLAHGMTSEQALEAVATFHAQCQAASRSAVQTAREQGKEALHTLFEETTERALCLLALQAMTRGEVRYLADAIGEDAPSSHGACVRLLMRYRWTG